MKRILAERGVLHNKNAARRRRFVRRRSVLRRFDGNLPGLYFGSAGNINGENPVLELGGYLVRFNVFRKGELAGEACAAPFTDDEIPPCLPSPSFLPVLLPVPTKWSGRGP